MEAGVETIGWVMAIFACGDPGTACTAVRLEPQHYASAAECMAATETTLPSLSGLPYPAVEARCRPAAQALADSQPARPRRG